MNGWSEVSITARTEAGARVLMVACKHGETSVAYVNALAPDAPRVSDARIAFIALVKHYTEQGCRCTRELRQRYGVEAAW